MIDTAEEWRTCLSAPNYEVSNIGRVRRRIDGPTGSKAGMIKAQQKMKTGYVQVTVHVENRPKTVNVHRLVCAAFHGPQPSECHEVAHNDGVRWNNEAANLRWATKKENQKDRRAHGTLMDGEKHYLTSLTKLDVLNIYNDNRVQRIIASEYGVTQQTISKIKLGQTWKSLAA